MDARIYPVPEASKEHTLITAAQYDEMYARSVDDNEGFWEEQAQRLDWVDTLISFMHSYEKENA